MALMADSAMRPDRRPLFLPSGNWECQIRMAVRIDRLGKAVGSRFASRYYSEYAPVNYLRPLDAQQWPDMIDDSLVTGHWRQLPACEEKIWFDGIEGAFRFDREAFDNILSRLSANTTFKTGDMIILPDAVIVYRPVRDKHVDVKINGSTALEFNIK